MSCVLNEHNRRWNAPPPPPVSCRGPHNRLFFLQQSVQAHARERQRKGASQEGELVGRTVGQSVGRLVRCNVSSLWTVDAAAVPPKRLHTTDISDIPDISDISDRSSTDTTVDVNLPL